MSGGLRFARFEASGVLVLLSPLEALEILCVLGAWRRCFSALCRLELFQRFNSAQLEPGFKGPLQNVNNRHSSSRSGSRGVKAHVGVRVDAPGHCCALRVAENPCSALVRSCWDAVFS